MYLTRPSVYRLGAWATMEYALQGEETQCIRWRHYPWKQPRQRSIEARQLEAAGSSWKQLVDLLGIALQTDAADVRQLSHIL